MRIKIETKEVLVRGEKSFKILKIEALDLGELPVRYTAMEGAIYLAGKERLLLKNSGCYKKVLSKGQTIDLHGFEEIWSRIKFAGEMLKKTKKLLRSENEGWGETEKTFVA